MHDPNGNVLTFKEAGPLYSTKNDDFTKKFYCKVDLFAKTENPENPCLGHQILLEGYTNRKKTIADLKRSRRELFQTYLEIFQLQI